MVQCPKCKGAIVFDPETFETDELWNDTNNIYISGECLDCKREYSTVFDLAKIEVLKK
jgi:hypothetical protein